MLYNSHYILGKLNEFLEPMLQYKDEAAMRAFLENRFENEIGTPVFASADKEWLTAFTDLRLKLAEHMKLDNVIFLFGNGSSLYAGSQDTRKFELSKYMEAYSGLSSIIEEVGRLKGVEEQLNALITVHAYYHIIKDEEKEEQIVSLINEIKKDLLDSFVNSVEYTKLRLHDIFLRKLRAFGCLQRTRIYTTNYDLAFEYAMDKLGIEYTDGFSGFVNRVFDPRTLQVKDKTALVKIHGSVNWAVVDDTVKEFQPEFESGKITVKDAAPVLIYPTSNKLYQTYSSPYSELMRHMLDEMETGRNVVLVAGYKYGDEHINEILYKALENPNNIFYFFVRSPNNASEFVDRIMRLSESMPNITILTEKVLTDFKVIVEYLLPATPEKTDQEKAIEMLQKVLVGHAG